MSFKVSRRFRHFLLFSRTCSPITSLRPSLRALARQSLTFKVIQIFATIVNWESNPPTPLDPIGKHNLVLLLYSRHNVQMHRRDRLPCWF